MARPKGSPKLGGRKKGTPNKMTVVAKEAIAMAFEGIGGVEALTNWARDNQKEFYTQIWPKILPLQVTGEDGGPIKYQNMAEREIDQRLAELESCVGRASESAAVH